MAQYFTLEEANATLNVVRPLVEQILSIRQAILDRQPEVWPALEKAAGNGGGPAASLLAVEFDRLDALVRKIHALGVQLKDINLGLLDFPALREGREVYLCWKYGEDEIRYWHEVDAGFSGRQPL
jgi:hypothetical protein